MKVSERLALIDKIGRELQSRFSYLEIDNYLAAFGIEPPKAVSSNSKWIYAKQALGGVDLPTVLKIAEDLDMEGLAPGVVVRVPPANWRDTNDFKLFISHLSKDKAVAKRLKECLSAYGISGFVAHEDIHPTLEWQSEIERALIAMDAMVAVHTKGFSQSYWTQQEIGFALGRGVKIISFKMGEDPTGFISKRQALARQRRTAEDIAAELDRLLSNDPLTAERLSDAKEKRFGSSVRDEIPF